MADGHTTLDAVLPVHCGLSSWLPEELYSRYGLRMEQYRLPKGVAKRDAFLIAIGEDGY